MKVVKEFSVCGGRLIKLSHNSNSTKTSMNVNIYLPKHYYAQDFPRNKRIPTVFYLSGLTCTPDNASEKAFWQFQADKYGFAMIFPDTSPRGDEVANDPEGSWDFGQGAGFYLNATQEPYAQHYQMYDYIHKNSHKH
ncbi:BFH_collapsed_G0029370.mRNA.1.CDS.1 [Saccharomyces cerevisiae]|nr:BFH_collapsed_G0029370.mRNA.1.CDS.1 [Saccharomyces cerevisiae]